MKKLIAILTIMIVLAGVVFADETPNVGDAGIRVVTLITVEEPTFILKTANATSGVLGSTTPGTMATVTSPDASATDAYHVITTNDLTKTDSASTSVAFQIVQTRSSKSYKYYTFTVAATNLFLVKTYNNANVLEDFTLGENQTYGTDQQFVCTTPAPNPVRSATGSSEHIIDQTAPTTGGYKVKYDGHRVDANIEIATFTCTWTNNADAVPGQYEGTVTLTVAAN